jgi:hypothetical protein
VNQRSSIPRYSEDRGIFGLGAGGDPSVGEGTRGEGGKRLQQPEVIIAVEARLVQ